MIPKTKVWYKSKSIQAGIVTQIGLMVMVFNVDVPSEQVEEMVGMIFTIIANGVQIYGRVVAKDRLSK